MLIATKICTGLLQMMLNLGLEAQELATLPSELFDIWHADLLQIGATTSLKRCIEVVPRAKKHGMHEPEKPPKMTQGSCNGWLMT